jgi:hypothetical protein
MIRQAARVTISRQLLALGFAGLIAFELSSEFPLAPVATAQPAANPAIASDPSEKPDTHPPETGTVADIVARPLFSASRRPFEAAADQGPMLIETPDQPPALQLIGTMVTGNERVALLRDPRSGLLRLRRGQKVGDWLVLTIDEVSVHLQDGGNVEQLMLQKEAPSATSARAVPKGETDDRRTGEASAITLPTSGSID